MQRDDPNPSHPRPPAPGPGRGRRAALLVVTGVVVTAAVCSLTAAAYRYWRANDVPPEPTPGGGGQHANEPFKGWPKPELVLVLSGQMHGYMLPCGCSRPQYGGLERRYNFLQKLQGRGW